MESEDLDLEGVIDKDLIKYSYKLYYLLKEIKSHNISIEILSDGSSHGLFLISNSEFLNIPLF